MDRINIKGIILTPLKKIHHPKGDILHGIKKSDQGFVGFGEAYFSTIKFGEIKGWNKHKRMTLNLVVPIGKVEIVVYDDRRSSQTKGNFFNIEISVDTYQRLTIPPGVWLAFKGNNKDRNMILNVSDMEHDPDEIERLNLDQIEYDWNDL